MVRQLRSEQQRLRSQRSRPLHRHITILPPSRPGANLLGADCQCVSAEKDYALDNRFHRTDLTLSCAAPPWRVPDSGKLAKREAARPPGHRTVPRPVQRETVSKLLARGLPVHQTAPLRKKIRLTLHCSPHKKHSSAASDHSHNRKMSFDTVRREVRPLVANGQQQNSCRAEQMLVPPAICRLSQ